jgi:hypothetical protein
VLAELVNAATSFASNWISQLLGLLSISSGPAVISFRWQRCRWFQAERRPFSLLFDVSTSYRKSWNAAYPSWMLES